MNTYKVDLSRPKPRGLDSGHAEMFQDQCVVESYHLRPPYCRQVYDILSSLTRENPRLLDIGCGCGDLTLGLLNLSKDVTAIDASRAMLNQAQTRPGSESVHWIASRVEDANLSGRFDLITAAQSMHWMNWPILFPRLKEVLSDDGFLVIVSRNYYERPWWNSDFIKLINRFSMNREFTHYETITELIERGYFDLSGKKRTLPQKFSQSVDDFIECFHSRNGFSKDRMGTERVKKFKGEMLEFLKPFSVDGYLNPGTISEVTWGRVL